MSSVFPPCAAVLVLAAACAAHAADVPSSLPPATPATESPAAAAPSAQMAVRDAATGRLRAPTAVEAQALHAAGPQALRAAHLSPTQNLTRTHRSGATGARLTDNALSYSMVVRQPDGRFAEYCFSNRDAAEAVVATPPLDALPTE